MNYHHLYLFWTLAQKGTFTKTAESLRIAQSAVTSQIKQLEEVLGLVLVDRTNRRKPVLTEDGKKILEYANSIFEAGDELLKWARQGSTNKNQVLRIGALSGLSRNFQYEFLSPIVGDNNIRIEVTTGDQEKLVRLLKDHELDLILSSHRVASEGRVTFYSHVLKTSPMVFVVSKKKKNKSLTAKELFKTSGLCIPGRSFEARAEVEAYLDHLKIPLNVVCEIDDIALLRIFATRSDLIVLIPEMGVLSEIASGEVEVITQPKDIEQRFYAITRQKRGRNHTLESLIQRMRLKH